MGIGEEMPGGADAYPVYKTRESRPGKAKPSPG